MKKGQLINLKTGEIIDEWKYVTNIEPANPDKFYQRVMVNGTSFTEDNIGMFEYDKGGGETEHPYFGRYKDLRSRKIFSKVFQAKDPNFDKASYYQCWHKIICRLSKNTNVVFTKVGGKKRVCETLDDLINLTGVSPSTFYKFYDEVSTRKLMGKMVFKNSAFFIVNPNYSLNGWKMPQLLFDYFENPLGNKEEE